ncbi:hypothetical protein OGAPHI_002555 [Ogataea philodendri]|uniref:Cell wall protein n=1 Tax=Ogataea philodendri TaxID=1378263 RepID=A0A9P8PC17_9ASCO|nr:uncharacterized protein OGAPHI_002555 [Ogataea philodendri]KAH3668800.1 hypothetical protein OGAPHI_002555 [Ogataea philodendri]
MKISISSPILILAAWCQLGSAETTHSYQFAASKVDAASSLIAEMGRSLTLDDTGHSTVQAIIDVFSYDVSANEKKYKSFLRATNNPSASTFVNKLESVLSYQETAASTGSDVTKLVQLELGLMTAVPWVDTVYQELAYQLDAVSYASNSSVAVDTKLEHFHYVTTTSGWGSSISPHSSNTPSHSAFSVAAASSLANNTSAPVSTAF